MIHPKGPSGSRYINMTKELSIQAIRSLNGSALAYLGDSVYERAVREHVLVAGGTQAKALHRATIKFVSAQAQASIMQSWLTQTDFLSEEEIDVYKRGRNHKANTKAKNASIGEYRQATGFEALIGWLYLNKKQQRLEELIQLAIQYVENEVSNG